jgi:translation elongation factor EF-Ts
MALDLKTLKKLREETGVSFSVCKKALEEAGNDVEKCRQEHRTEKV